jgi:hypothetical protein
MRQLTKIAATSFLVLLSALLAPIGDSYGEAKRVIRTGQGIEVIISGI